MGIVAIFGGTFNPIHKGHREIIDALVSISEVDKVILVPTKIPPHKNTDALADANDRLNMCRLVADDYSKVSVSDIELQRAGKSYSIDTVKYFKNLFPENEIALTIGADMVASFEKWKNYQEILKNASIIAFKRVGVPDDEYLFGIERIKEAQGKVIEIPISITELSSTDVRNNLNKTNAALYLDSKVFDYILENDLYGEKNGL